MKGRNRTQSTLQLLSPVCPNHLYPLFTEREKSNSATSFCTLAFLFNRTQSLPFLCNRTQSPVSVHWRFYATQSDLNRKVNKFSLISLNPGFDYTFSIIIVFQRASGADKAIMDVDSQPGMEETILVGDDLMMGPPSPLIPPEIASHVLENVDLCDGILKNLFLCLQINDIEPFCQDEIAMYRQCAERRDKELRQRMQDSEWKLGLSMPLDQAKDRAAQLQSEVTSLNRRFILASGMEGMEGFRQRWSLHGRLEDTKKRLEALNRGMEKRNN